MAAMNQDPVVGAVLSLDLGGSKLALALVTPDGALARHAKRPTAEIQHGDELVGWVKEEFARWGQAPEALGISCGGPIDDVRGVIVRWPRMEMLWEYPLATALQRALPSVRVVRLVNDACAACAGEVLFGEAVGLRNTLYLTISTGIGGGAFVGGMLLRGDRGNVAEFGHCIVLPGGPRCDCGCLGCLEAVASAVGLYRQLVAAGIFAEHERGWADLGYWLKDRISEGDDRVLPLWRQALAGLATGLVNLWNSYVPQAIVLGGGLSTLVQQSRDELGRLIEERAKLMPIPVGVLRFSENRHTIPLLGAAAVAGGWVPQEA
jgi:glucokinase